MTASTRRGSQPQATGELLNRRILEHRLAAADHHRDVVRRQVESVQQLLALRVGIQVALGVGMSIAGEELADVQRPRAMLGSQHDHVTVAAVDQLKAAQAESAQKYV